MHIELGEVAPGNPFLSSFVSALNFPQPVAVPRR